MKIARIILAADWHLSLVFSRISRISFSLISFIASFSSSNNSLFACWYILSASDSRSFTALHSLVFLALIS
jgi:hypothetical protein